MSDGSAPTPAPTATPPTPVPLPEPIVERPRPNKRLGWHRYHRIQNRNYPVTAAPRLARRLAQPLRYRRWGGTSVILNQGELGSCTGNACVGMLARNPLRPLNASTRFGQTLARQLYSAATGIDDTWGIPGRWPTEDTGSTTVAVLTAAQNLNLIDEFRWSFSFEDTLSTLCNVGPMICGMDWDEGFDHPDVLGQVTFTGRLRGGHEICLVAYLPDPHAEGGAWIEFVNSWGKGYGINGRARMSAATLRYLLIDRQGEAGIGLKAGV